MNIQNKDYSNGQIRDMAEKLEQIDPAYLADTKHSVLHSEKNETALSRTATESAKMSREQMHNLIAMSMKHCLFNTMVSSGAESKETRQDTSAMSTLAGTVDVARAIEKQELKKIA